MHTHTMDVRLSFYSVYGMCARRVGECLDGGEGARGTEMGLFGSLVRRPACVVVLAIVSCHPSVCVSYLYTHPLVLTD